jgi:hypothetical protein
VTSQVFVASTSFGLATLVAALEQGLFAAGTRRILVMSNNAATPETTDGLEDVVGTASLLRHFSTAHSYNAAVAPQHPSTWRPRGIDLPLWERYLRHQWARATTTSIS